MYVTIEILNTHRINCHLAALRIIAEKIEDNPFEQTIMMDTISVFEAIRKEIKGG